MILLVPYINKHVLITVLSIGNLETLHKEKVMADPILLDLTFKVHVFDMSKKNAVERYMHHIRLFRKYHNALRIMY
jgi:hypothetical protein